MFLKKKNTKRSSVITPLVTMTLDPMRSTAPTMEEEHLKSGKRQTSQGLRWPKHQNRTSKVGDVRATFNQSALDIGIRTIDNFNKVLLKMTKHAFPLYDFSEQKRNLCRHHLGV